MARKRFVLACLDCGDEYTAKNDAYPCPTCGGPGELAVSNYEDSGWGDNSDFHDEGDLDLDNLAYDPNMFD